jgi:hypothetical protein
MRRVNWPIWIALPLSIVTLFSYPLVFMRWPATRDLPWVNLLLLVLTVLAIVAGIRRAFAPGRRWFSRLAAVLMGGLSVAVLASFVYGVFVVARRLPESRGAPLVGQKAPDFRLPDTNRQLVSLSELLSAPIRSADRSQAARGVLLIFYRGFW